MIIKMADIKEVKKTMNRFKISWKMTEWCNYRCKYCYMSNAIARNKPTTPMETILQIASKIDELLEKQANKRKVNIHLIGGEVGYYNLIEVFEKIKTPLLTVVVATNFSNKLSYWKELSAYLRQRGTNPNIIASFHLDQCIPEEFCDKAIEVGAKVKAVINHENLKKYKPYFDYLLDNNITVQPTIQRDNKNVRITLTESEQKYVDYLNQKMNEKQKNPYFIVTLKNGEKIKFGSNIEFINSIDIGGFDSEGFFCTAGLDGIRIKPNGDLQRGGCKMAFLNGQLGNILTGYELPDEPFICTSRFKENGIEGIKYCTAFSNASMWRVK